MLKAISLIFEPLASWERVVVAARSVLQIVLLFLLPLIFFSVAGEAAGILYFGKYHNAEGVLTIPRPHLYLYFGVQFLADYLMVFIGGWAVTILAKSFNRRHKFPQCFTVVAYCLSPLFLLRLLDMIPVLNPWISFALGIILSIATLYYGLPAVLEPDPPNTFGMYMMSAMTLFFLTAIGRALTLFFLFGHLPFFNHNALSNY